MQKKYLYGREKCTAAISLKGMCDGKMCLNWNGKMRTLDSCYDDYNEHDDNDYVVVKLMN